MLEIYFGGIRNLLIKSNLMESSTAELAQQIKDSITCEFYRVLGMGNQRWFQRITAPFVDSPTTKFAALLLAFDAQVNQIGLQETAGNYLDQFVCQKQVRGQEHIPADGPVIVVSNHPGAFDGVFLASSITRCDLKAVVTGVAVLQALPEMNQRFIYTSEDPYQRMSAFRAALRHIQKGGVLLTFGTGIVDPDPAFLGTASTALVPWSDSLALFLQKCPAARVVPAVVSGVLERAYYDLLPVRWIPDRVRRQKLAEYLMVMQMLRHSKKFDVIPCLSFGVPYELVDASMTASEILPEIMSSANQLLHEHMQEFY